MTKRLVDIDDGLLDQALKLTGAATIKGTVNASLHELNNTELRLRRLRRLMAGEGTDLSNDEIMADAWRWRHYGWPTRVPSPDFP